MDEYLRYMRLKNKHRLRTGAVVGDGRLNLVNIRSSALLSVGMIKRAAL
jgi:hypothetical protein